MKKNIIIVSSSNPFLQELNEIAKEQHKTREDIKKARRGLAMQRSNWHSDHFKSFCRTQLHLEDNVVLHCVADENGKPHLAVHVMDLRDYLAGTKIPGEADMLAFARDHGLWGEQRDSFLMRAQSYMLEFDARNVLIPTVTDTPLPSTPTALQQVLFRIVQKQAKVSPADTIDAPFIEMVQNVYSLNNACMPLLRGHEPNPLSHKIDDKTHLESLLTALDANRTEKIDAMAAYFEMLNHPKRSPQSRNQR